MTEQNGALKRADLQVLAEIGQGTSTGAKLRRTFFDNFPQKRTRAQRLLWDGYVEFVGAGYVTLTNKGKSALKVA
jgi:hypothetical protein